MMHPIIDLDLLRVEQRRLLEMRVRAQEARQARLARGRRPMRRQIGTLLIVAGEALAR